MQEILLKIRYLERGFSKTLKNANFIFPSEPSLFFDVESYQKQKGPGTTYQSLLRLQNMFRKIPLLVIYYLTKFDDVI